MAAKSAFARGAVPSRNASSCRCCCLQPVRCGECFRRDYRLIFTTGARPAYQIRQRSCRASTGYLDIETLPSGRDRRYTARVVHWPWQTVPAGAKEAVFSSSEDRTRASQASVAVAGLVLFRRRFRVCLPPLISTTCARAGPRAAESLFSVLFPSDCRICGEPLLNISRLPVCPRVPRADSARPRQGLLHLWRARAFVLRGPRCRRSADLSRLPPHRASL